MSYVGPDHLTLAFDTKGKAGAGAAPAPAAAVPAHKGGKQSAGVLKGGCGAASRGRRGGEGRGQVGRQSTSRQQGPVGTRWHCCCCADEWHSAFQGAIEKLQARRTDSDRSMSSSTYQVRLGSPAHAHVCTVLAGISGMPGWLGVVCDGRNVVRLLVVSAFTEVLLLPATTCPPPVPYASRTRRAGTRCRPRRRPSRRTLAHGAVGLLARWRRRQARARSQRACAAGPPCCTSTAWRVRLLAWLGGWLSSMRLRPGL